MQWSTPARAVFLWYPGTEDPVILKINDKELCCCVGCDAVVQILALAHEAQPDKRDFQWVLGRVVFQDGFTLAARNPRAERVAAA